VEGLHAEERRLLRAEKVVGRRADLLLALAALAAGALFFSSLDELWPLARTDLARPAQELRAEAREHLARRGFDLAGYRAADVLTVDTAALDHVERTYGRERAQAWIAGGVPLVTYRIQLKKPGEVVEYAVRSHPAGGVIGWSRTVPEDEVRPRLPLEAARALARRAISHGLGLDPATLVERSASSEEEPGTRIHAFGFERVLAADPELVERVQVRVAGDEVVLATRLVHVPEAAERRARAAQAPAVALETVGFGLLALAALAAFAVFLKSLAAGSVQLARATVWPVAVFVCLVASEALGTSNLFAHWEPLWPRWVSDLRYLVLAAIEHVWIVVVLLAVVAAGDALDRRLGAGRGDALWALARGRLRDPGVARASRRGFLVGLVCGGTLAGGVLLLRAFAGAECAIQPRGFFFHTLNSAAPALTSVLFFFGIALAEELGYRFFGASWLLSLGKRPWIAIVVPGLIYGLVHTRLDFLPPAEPFWARPFVLTAVGCVWGWAFLRYDALTVVLSHLTADLFIFNWPRLASGKTGAVVAALAALAVPLLPALLDALRRVWRSSPRPSSGRVTRSRG
jgi:hypothetical protein